MQVHIGFSSHPGWLASLIKYCTKSKASHTFIILPLTGIEQLVIHAQGLKVNAIDLDVFMSTNTVLKVFPVEISMEKVYWLYRQLGKSYGILELIGYIWVLIGNRLGKKWANPLADGEKTYVCSELAASVLDLLHPEEYSPQDLLNYLEGKENGKINN